MSPGPAPAGEDGLAAGGATAARSARRRPTGLAIFWPCWTWSCPTAACPTAACPTAACATAGAGCESIVPRPSSAASRRWCGTASAGRQAKPPCGQSVRPPGGRDDLAACRRAGSRHERLRFSSPVAQRRPMQSVSPAQLGEMEEGRGLPRSPRLPPCRCRSRTAIYLEYSRQRLGVIPRHVRQRRLAA